MTDDTKDPLDEQASKLARAICDHLRDHRKRQNLSIYRLAQMTGLSDKAITYIEEGKRTPSIETVARIALALGLTVSDVVAEAEQGREQ